MSAIGMSTWRYYNHAAISALAPHEVPDLSCVSNGDVWNIGGGAVLAQWTEEFDCGLETRWWLVIKDTPFDISSLKSKRRYEIRKGQRNFDVRAVKPSLYIDELANVHAEAIATYGNSTFDFESFKRNVETWEKSNRRIYAAFSSDDTAMLSGYAVVTPHDGYVDYTSQKALPSAESLGVNAALVAKILEDFGPELSRGIYICDGSRNINHATHFQDYLEKYFGFRKAYCKLHIAYKPPLGAVVTLLYPFRALLSKLDGFKPVHLVNGVLKMEEAARC